MHKRKYRLRYSRLVILILFIFIIFVFVKWPFGKNEEIAEPVIQKSKYVANITDDSEKNKSIVKKYFASGMNADDYKNTIEKIDNYIEVEGIYSKISYDFEKNYHYNELEEFYKELAKSSIVKLEIIGVTNDNRNIYALEIGSGDEVTIFEAGIHASESANPLFALKFMVDIVNAYEDGDKEITKLLSNNKIVVMPAANPDGYEITLFGTKYTNNQKLYLASSPSKALEYLKCNARGVDINRNFPSQTAGLYYKEYDLHESVSLSKSYDINAFYSGDTLGSEPETRAIMYIQNKWLPNLKSYVALHSAGQSIYNGKPYLSDEYNTNSNICAEIVGNITDYFVLHKEDEPAGEGNDGTSTEYMAETLSGFIFSSETGRLSSDYYKKYYNQLKYKNTCVMTIEALDEYTTNLKTIKKEYYNHNLEDAYIAVIDR